MSAVTSSVLITVLGLGIIALTIAFIRKRAHSGDVSFTLVGDSGKKKSGRRKGKLIELI